MLGTTRKGSRSIVPFNHSGPGRPKRGMTKQFSVKLEYPEASHILKEVKERDITIYQYFNELVREDRILKSGKAS